MYLNQVITWCGEVISVRISHVMRERRLAGLHEKKEVRHAVRLNGWSGWFILAIPDWSNYGSMYLNQNVRDMVFCRKKRQF